ncbi:hypothetical protein FRB90_003847 [Tulasnella sp. 427]|nr:hypothetical protein FRB90_003847 [Tulasnella sp. 427]
MAQECEVSVEKGLTECGWPDCGCENPPASVQAESKVLAALTKYGEDLDMYATPEYLALSTTNSSKSAYGRWRVTPEFFEKYRIGADAISKEVGQNQLGADDDGIEELDMVSGQIPTKASAISVAGLNTADIGSYLQQSLYSILRNHGADKNVERCEIAIVPGRLGDSAPRASGTTTSSQGESFSSTLLIRLHCKYGVKKTHRLALNPPSPLVAPNLPVTSTQSSVVVGPRAVKDLMDHFNLTKTKGGRAAGLRLIWEWGGEEVTVKSSAGLLGGPSGKYAPSILGQTWLKIAADSQIATSISVDAEEFDQYEVPAPPVCFGFELKEFLAAIILADNLSLQLNLAFTDAGSPLAITIESDGLEALFVVATKDMSGKGSNAQTTSTATNGRKRAGQHDAEPQRKAKSMKVVSEADQSTITSFRASSTSSSTSRTRQPSIAFEPEVRQPSAAPSDLSRASRSETARATEPTTPTPLRAASRKPLFHTASPSAVSSQRSGEGFHQLSQADQAAFRASGLGLETMTPAEIAAMLDDDDMDMDVDAEATVARARQAEKPAVPVWRNDDPPPIRQEFGFGDEMTEEERMEMEDDPLAGEVEDDDGEDSFLPLTQFDAKARSGRQKHFEALDFGDD